MYVLAFDRDWTVDVNPHPHRVAVPLEWVRYWAHESNHEVWAIGNQDLVEEADIPGTVESIRRRDGHIDALGEQDEYGYYEWWPEREERLQILAELFPDAEGYIAVDDLDLGHVDGWDHYHAWDFVEHLHDGELGLSVPSSSDLIPDGGFESSDAVRDVLADGYVFELTHRTDGEQKTHLVTHFEPERPSMTPLKGPPAFWFETVGNDERFSVRLPEIEALYPVEIERLPDALTGPAFAAVRKQLTDDAASVDSDTLQSTLATAAADSSNVDRVEALRLAMKTVEHRDDSRDVAGETIFALLADEPGAIDRAALQTLHTAATDNPTILDDHVGELDAVLDAFDAELYAYGDHPRRDRALGDGDEIEIGDETADVVYTPGHAGDHVSLVAETALFSGDVVVYNDGAFDDGSFGRTDMAGQSRERLVESLRELLDRLPDSVESLYAGHGDTFHADADGDSVRDVIERALARAERREPKYPEE